MVYACMVAILIQHTYACIRWHFIHFKHCNFTNMEVPVFGALTYNNRYSVKIDGWSMFYWHPNVKIRLELETHFIWGGNRLMDFSYLGIIQLPLICTDAIKRFSIEERNKFRNRNIWQNFSIRVKLMSSLNHDLDWKYLRSVDRTHFLIETFFGAIE